MPTSATPRLTLQQGKIAAAKVTCNSWANTLLRRYAPAKAPSASISSG
ncbi:hypothetical protein H6F56_21265 [Microcoleus sp. FACHB-672]|nr:hypothetical protein [Microcoleus sp. FACHB-672]